MLKDAPAEMKLYTSLFIKWTLAYWWGACRNGPPFPRHEVTLTPFEHSAVNESFYSHVQGELATLVFHFFC